MAQGVIQGGLGSSTGMRMRRTAPAPALAAIAAIALAGAVACSPGPAPGQLAESSAGHAALLANTGQTQGTLKIASGATAITIATARSNGPLVTASTSSHANVRPVITRGRVIRIALRPARGSGAPATLRVWLNAAVRWDLIVGGGAVGLVMNLRSARLGTTDIDAGFTAITMRLPKPPGTATVTLAGGASRVRLFLPSAVPAQVRLDGGAGHATLAGRTYAGVAGGTVLTAPGWAKATRRYRIEAPAGVSSISVSR